MKVAPLKFIKFRAIMATNIIGLIPGLLKCVGDILGENKSIIIKVLDVVFFCFQLAAIITWSILEKDTMQNVWALPVGLILISFGWWECYVTDKGPFKFLWSIREKMSVGKGEVHGKKELINKNVAGVQIRLEAKDEKAPARGPTYFAISLWKMAFFLMCMSIMVKTEGILSQWNTLYTDFTKSFESTEYILKISSQELLQPVWNNQLKRWEKLWQGPALVIVVQILCSWILYSVGKFAYRCDIHRLCFALPMTLVTPVCLWTLTPLCVYRNKNACDYTSTFPDHLFFNCPEDMSADAWFLKDVAFMGILWFISFCWITSQIWFAPGVILAETTRIFSKYYYHGLLVDSCLMLNRIDDSETKRVNEEKGVNKEVPNVKGCATMWHETPEEIKVCLKSMFKMDEDYCVQKAYKKVNDRNDSFFEWESNIFFDDAMKILEEPKSKAKKEKGKDVKEEMKWVVNDWVVGLVNTVEEYGSWWYKRIGVEFEKPTKILTPYGGRLTWKLPGGTKLVCHMKDKNRIRHKKR